MTRTINKKEIIGALEIASLYGEENLFNKKLNEGYSEISFARGNYIYTGKRAEKITRMWAFYHPNGSIFTHQVPKSKDTIDDFPCRGIPFDREYSQDEFEKYIKEKKISS